MPGIPKIAAATITMRCAARSPGSRATRPTCRPILRYLKADGETQAGLYSHEPACPNAQNQGEFTPPDFRLSVLGARGRVRPAPASAMTTSSRAAAAIRGRPRRPRAVLRRPRDPRRDSCAWTHDFGDATSPRSRITRRPTSSTSRVAMPRRSRAWSSSRAATSTRSRRSSACRGRSGAHEFVGGLFDMDVDGDYTGKFADPVLRLRSGLSLSSGTAQERPRMPRSSRTNGASAIAGS